MGNPAQDRKDEANFMSRMLTWDEVRTIATNDGYVGSLTKPGELARYFAWRTFQRNRGLLAKPIAK